MRLHARTAELQPAALPVTDGRCWSQFQRGDGETALREAQLEPDEGLSCLRAGGSPLSFAATERQRTQLCLTS